MGLVEIDSICGYALAQEAYKTLEELAERFSNSD